MPKNSKSMDHARLIQNIKIWVKLVPEYLLNPSTNTSIPQQNLRFANFYNCEWTIKNGRLTTYI